jgi:predicted  nucleic acid-binding Zn-ribbon protein
LVPGSNPGRPINSSGKGASLKEGLELLYLLQQFDDRIRDIEKTIIEIPETIAQLESERDSKKHIIENAKSRRNDNVKQREQLENQILQIREKIKKYREQMNKCTTNKEYQGFINEIQFEESKISEVEEDIIQRMLEFDEIMDEIRESELEFKKIADEYNQRIKELNNHLDFNKSKLNEETANKTELRKKIPENLLRTYDSLSEKKNGKVISIVETEFCGICNIKIRPQLLNEIISTNNLFICENCGRILVKIIRDEEPERTDN